MDKVCISWSVPMKIGSFNLWIAFKTEPNRCSVIVATVSTVPCNFGLYLARKKHRIFKEQ